MLLWPNGAPGALGQEDRDKPAITVYMPPNTTGPMTAVIIAPGGSYARLSMNHEGRAPANYLQRARHRGVRPALPPRTAVSPSDRARRRAARDPHRPIARRRMAHRGRSHRHHGLFRRRPSRVERVDAFRRRQRRTRADPIDRVSSRPDFAILGYPVISFVEPWTHQGSKTNLLGENPDPALARSLSSETQVTATTPPTFIYHTNADTIVPVENAVAYYLALRKAGVSGRDARVHGRRARQRAGAADPALAEWPRLLANWLRVSGFLK